MPARASRDPGLARSKEVAQRAREILAKTGPYAEPGQKAVELTFLISDQQRSYRYILSNVADARRDFAAALANARQDLQEANAGVLASLKAWHDYEASLGGPEEIRLAMLRDAGTLPHGENPPGFIGPGIAFFTSPAGEVVSEHVVPSFPEQPTRQAAVNQYLATQRQRREEDERRRAAEATVRTRKQRAAAARPQVEAAVNAIRPQAQQVAAAIDKAQRTLM